METDDIITVLSQASDLRGKIYRAIERVSDHEREINSGKEVPLMNGNAMNGDCSLSAEEAVAMEARSLASIKDSFDVLEDQLYCLQILQEQQQAEKEAALSDLEESRRILLQRLRKHRGRERAVVKEALAFVGEPVEEEHAKYCEDPDPSMNGIKLLAWIQESEEELLPHPENCQTDDEITVTQKEHITPMGFLKFLGHRLRKSLGCASSLAFKTAIIAAGIMTVVGVSNVTKKRVNIVRHHKALAASPLTDQKLDIMQEYCQPAHEGVAMKSGASTSVPENDGF